MKTMYEIPLHLIEQQTVKLPKGADILAIEFADPVKCNNLVLIAKGNDNLDLDDRKINIYEKGSNVNEYDLDYIGSKTLLIPMPKTFHVFENTKG